ncbi:hypothetical protein [Candidatus Phytoplasma meliae]|uniref:Uncharacterized protein n=1 Tax=Candidatus Phytoplasma meliae TaxID=1848402 RepID=A0ABS5CZ20_9MOLU|nr:hypothetical protein [Candidatus Phytoplasma meliae]MBP5835778.1 hypothetical protein [Candidatus Phytoplasma meliae]MBP5836211.1 hypothetical protein [Candidatus Phytoplasma meliae]
MPIEQIINHPYFSLSLAGGAFVVILFIIGFIARKNKKSIYRYQDLQKEGYKQIKIIKNSIQAVFKVKDECENIKKIIIETTGLKPDDNKEQALIKTLRDTLNFKEPKKEVITPPKTKKTSKPKKHFKETLQEENKDLFQDVLQDELPQKEQKDQPQKHDEAIFKKE